MPTIAENLKEILQEKNNLKKSINAKNVGAINDSTPFSAYPNAIDAIQARTLDMSDRIISDVIEIKDYTGTSFDLKSCIKEVTLPEGVTSLGDSCFNDCIGLTSIDIPSGVTSLGNSCFYGCSGLTSIAIPSGVTSLGYQCFYDCIGLTSIDIPSGVTSLGDSCFYGCISLETVTCNAETPPTLGSSAFANCDALTAIYVPAQSVDAYKNATNWSKYASKIKPIE